MNRLIYPYFETYFFLGSQVHIQYYIKDLTIGPIFFVNVFRTSEHNVYLFKTKFPISRTLSRRGLKENEETLHIRLNNPTGN